MKIYIQHIQNNGTHLEESFPADWIGLTDQDATWFVLPVEVKAVITRVDKEIFAAISTKSQYVTGCYRCLKDLNRNWSNNFKIVFDVDKPMEFIDMDEDIRQEIILNLPTRILCQEDCRGLCIECGVNLNNQECKHAHAVAGHKS